MKNICKVTYVYPPYKNKEGVNIFKYSCEDNEGFRWLAYSCEKLKDGDNVLISLRNYKGKYYAKHLEISK